MLRRERRLGKTGSRSGALGSGIPTTANQTPSFMRGARLGKKRDFVMLHEQMVFSEKGDEPDAGTPKVKSTVPVRPCRSPERIQRPTPSRFPQYAPRSQRRSVSELAGGNRRRNNSEPFDFSFGRSQVHVTTPFDEVVTKGAL